MKTSLTAFLLLVSCCCWSQARYPVIGQRPSSAFPVCGTDTFTQAEVPIGQSGTVPIPGCGSYADTNPFWYSFTCYASGTLGFLIKPKNPNDDYDWQLFDVTGRDVNAVFTDIELVVTGNWAGTYGNTGTRSGASSVIQCGSDPADNHTTFTAMPTLKEGHKYLLLISHYTESQSGYTLTFNGGTALLVDPTLPTMKSAAPNCNRQAVGIGLSKKLRCSSLAADGSDFVLEGTTVKINGASGLTCSVAFDMDSLRLSLSSALDPGTYVVRVRTGTDGNTLFDDCGTQIMDGNELSFTVQPPKPTLMDSLITPTCGPQVLQLVFADPILCNSIASDGSDFKVFGNPGVTVTSAKSHCSDESSNIIDVILNGPIVKAGTYQIGLVKGDDGNTIVNECGLETPLGPAIPFHLFDTVSAAFTYDIKWGCVYDTITTFYGSNNGLTSWNWKVDSNFSSAALQPRVIESVFGFKKIVHSVTNGFCSDTVTQVVNLDNFLKAGFTAPTQVCPKDIVKFNNVSVGKVKSWFWEFGDGITSGDRIPADHLFPDTWAGKNYVVKLTVTDSLGCRDTVVSTIDKLQSCAIAVPNAFSPNGDGKNDYLYPLNGFMTTDMQFQVFNRYGQLVFETRDPGKKWDGKINGVTQGFGTYVWTLTYTETSSGKKITLRGTSMLIR